MSAPWGCEGWDVKRSLWIGIVLVFVALAIAGPVAMVRETILDRGGGGGAAPAAAAEAGGDGGGTTVTMQGLKFAPTTLTVPKGATVLFDNQDVAPHTVTSDEAGVDSGVIGPGKSFELAVERSFDYVCSIHPSMRARINVGTA
jgi:plastocyanin